MDHRVLVVPGHGNSGPAHWQSIWETIKPGEWQRLQVSDWERVVCDDWTRAIDRQIATLGDDAVIVAHSLGCLAAAHWAARHTRRVRAALFVAVPDPTAPLFPAALSIGFSPLPSGRLPLRSIVVASSDDPYGSTDYARSCAHAWGSDFVEVGAHGHLNADSGLGDWPEGYRLLERLRAASDSGP